jgi:predicted CXXCH cytochrome family protein
VASRKPWLAAALALVLGACGPDGEHKPADGPAPGAGAPEAAAHGGDAEARAAFVGAARCAGCHPAETEAWKGSHHDLAMQVAEEGSVLGDFRDAELASPTQTRFFRRDGGFWVTTEGPDGKPADFEVKYTFGVDPLQQYLVALPGGRLQVLPVAWDVAARRWFPLPAERVPPDDPFHWTGRYQNWNAMCAECHSTDLRKAYDEASDSYATSWAEIDVACEACHGPGRDHVAWAEAGAGDASAGAGLAVRFDAEQPHTEIDSCAPCHSRRARAAAEDLHGHAFLDDYAPSLLREGLYQADGQILEEVYEYGSFLQSRMYAKGVRCSDCHDPHSLRLRGEGNALCTRCHSETPNPLFPTLRAKRYDAAEHHHHAPGSDGARCVACHMPTRTYMAVDARRDHSLRIPRPDLSEKLGTPNACNACHGERSPAWAAKAIAGWFGPGRRQERHWGEILAAARAQAPGAGADLIALARDPEQPAIVRGTAVELLPLQGDEGAAALLDAAGDSEGLVRLGAARALDALPLDARIEPAERGIADPLRSVRIQAAHSLGPLATEFYGPRARRALLDALREYESLQRSEADLGPAHHNLALLAEAGGDVERATAEYRRALALDPGFQPARVNLATLLNRTGHNEESEALFREALARTPDDGEIHYSLGLLLAEEGRMAEAEAELAQATARLPRRARVRYNHALALQRLGRSDEALAELLSARDAAPDDPDVLHALVSFYALAGLWEKALPHARALVAISPGEGPRALLLHVEDEIAHRDAAPPPAAR